MLKIFQGLKYDLNMKNFISLKINDYHNTKFSVEVFLAFLGLMYAHANVYLQMFPRYYHLHEKQVLIFCEKEYQQFFFRKVFFQSLSLPTKRSCKLSIPID